MHGSNIVKCVDIGAWTFPCGKRDGQNILSCGCGFFGVKRCGLCGVFGVALVARGAFAAFRAGGDLGEGDNFFLPVRPHLGDASRLLVCPA